MYTVRISTGSSRGSGLDEPMAGVQLCLVGANGSAVLHRVSPVFDPAALQEELDAIHEVTPDTALIEAAIRRTSAERQNLPSEATVLCSTFSLSQFT